MAFRATCPTPAMEEDPATATELAPGEAARLIAAGAQLVDVREPEERAASRIGGSVHIPLDELAASARRLDRDRPIVFQCHLGARSAYATDAFRAAGYDAYNLTGGIVAWAENGLPVER